MSPGSIGETRLFSTPDGGGGRAHLLLVDDDTDLLLAVGQMLRHLGYGVTAFAAPTEALAAFTAAPERFDGVVTDFMMPEMRGDALLKRIRTIRPDIPVVMVSGLASTIQLPDVEGTPAVLIVAKPLSLARLKDALNQVLWQQRG